MPFENRSHGPQHRPRHGPLSPLQPYISVWLQVAAQATHPDMVYHNSSPDGYQYGSRWQLSPPWSIWPWPQHDPRAPTWPQVLAQTPGICITFSASWSYPDMALGSTLDLTSAVAKGDSADHSGRLVLAAAHPSDPNMARGSGPEARHSCGLWWQHGPWTSTQIPALIGPWIQNGPWQHARLRCHHGLGWQCRAFRYVWPQQQHDPGFGLGPVSTSGPQVRPQNFIVTSLCLNQIEDKLLKMHLHNFLYISLRYFLYFYLYVYLCSCVCEYRCHSTWEWVLSFSLLIPEIELRGQSWRPSIFPYWTTLPTRYYFL